MKLPNTPAPTTEFVNAKGSDIPAAYALAARWKTTRSWMLYLT